MKTTKRSKMLLSSIAMLLVALVALGSATYAWYTVNETVTAKDATFTAAAPKGLVISTDQSTWKSSVDLGLDVSGLQPASLTFNTSGIATAYNIEANDVEAYGLKSTATLNDVSADTTNTYFTVGDFYVKSQNDAMNVDVKVKKNDAYTGSFINYAIIDVTTGKASICGVVYSDGTPHKALDSNKQEVAIYSGTDNPSAANTTFTTVGSTISLIADDVHHFKVIAYADGQNSNCFTTSSTANTAVSYEIQVTKHVAAP